jgi:hypothetical protein
VPDVSDVAGDFTSSFEALRFALAPRAPDDPPSVRDREPVLA